MVMTNIPSGVPQPKNMYGLGGGDINSFRGIKVLLVYGEGGGMGPLCTVMNYTYHQMLLGNVSITVKNS